MTPALDRVLEVFDIGRDTWRVVRQNLFWAFFYNAVGITLAVAGILTPILAAGAMVLSSLSVITNSLRLSGRWDRTPGPSLVNLSSPSQPTPPRSLQST
jgi:cation transport ATPase